MLLSEGQMSDHKSDRLVLNALPPSNVLITDRGYDSTWFRQALVTKGIEPLRVCRRPFRLSYAAIAGASMLA